MTKRRRQSPRGSAGGLGPEWQRTRDGMAWCPSPGVEYRIDQGRSGMWRVTYFGVGSDYGDRVTEAAAHAYDAAEAAEEHWSARGRRP